MFVCTTVLYEYMKSLRNDVNNLFDNTHVLLKIYPEFYHSIIYIANEGPTICMCEVKYISNLSQHYLYSQ
jgi:hypothetical protein